MVFKIFTLRISLNRYTLEDFIFIFLDGNHFEITFYSKLNCWLLHVLVCIVEIIFENSHYLSILFHTNCTREKTNGWVMSRRWWEKNVCVIAGCWGNFNSLISFLNKKIKHDSINQEAFCIFQCANRKSQ